MLIGFGSQWPYKPFRNKEWEERLDVLYNFISCFGDGGSCFCHSLKGDFLKYRYSMI